MFHFLPRFINQCIYDDDNLLYLDIKYSLTALVLQYKIEFFLRKRLNIPFCNLICRCSEVSDHPEGYYGVYVYQCSNCSKICIGLFITARYQKLRFIKLLT